MMFPNEIQMPEVLKNQPRPSSRLETSADLDGIRHVHIDAFRRSAEA